ncbi:hypothetical protein RW1_012_00020 [Rhodococcus wratislaviensis NBRC 100605]|uniref:Uncharacterized protein n=1 Tax=Rhodococcus wratislaviensis NBRC 100605 TaxID=1219028 RepID=X0PNG5_RHOWR|nr:hypothetical protein RW1_012_00020 [Rhodococcus wratislaviensis NBRC 100605]
MLPAAEFGGDHRHGCELIGLAIALQHSQNLTLFGPQRLRDDRLTFRISHRLVRNGCELPNGRAHHTTAAHGTPELAR